MSNDIVAINCKHKTALTDDDQLVPITGFFDSQGDECELENAYGFVCGSDETGWFTDVLHRYPSIQPC